MDMATAGTIADSQDSWGQPSAQIINTSRRPAAHATPVPDDWDAEDCEEEPDAKELWESANSRAPMPQIQPATTAASTGTQLPPAAAFEAPLRILKRPSAASSKSPSPLNGAQTQKSFKEREAQYQAARERIFGEEGKEKEKEKERDGNGKPKLAPSAPKSSIIRDPIGPAVADGEPKRGFRGRRKKGSRSGTALEGEAGGETKGE